MSSFRYRAATADGQFVDGVLQASSQRGALEELRRQQLFPVELAAVASEKPVARGTLDRTTALAVFARTIGTMLSAGVPLDRALRFASEQARHPEVTSAGLAAHEALQEGATLTEAIGRHPDVFGSLFTAMVAAGEESGALDESLNALAGHLDELVELRAQVRSSLVYPALMAFATGLGIVVLLLFVVPRFVAMLQEEGSTLPWSTQIMVSVSQLLVAGWWILLLLAIAAFFGARYWLTQPDQRARLHAWRLRFPLTGELELEYATARFTRAFGLLLRSGRPVLPALRAARAAVDNLHLASSLERAAQDVSHGQRVHTALAGTLPPLAAELLAVGEESGRLDELSLRVADVYEGEVRRQLRSLVSVIEPALILFFGLVVGFVALAMLQAIYSINRTGL